MRKRERFALKNLGLTLLGVVLTFTSADARTVTIGVVRDGPMVDFDVLPLLEAELSRVVDANVGIRLKQEAAFDARWDPSRYRLVLENALADPEVDIVLLGGILVLEVAATTDIALTKPVVGAQLLRADIFAIPRDVDGRSGRENLSFILSTHQAVRDIETFRQIIPFERMHLGLAVEYLNSRSAQLSIEAHEAATGVDIVPFPVSDDVQETLERADPDSIEAVMISVTPRLPSRQRTELIAGLIAKKIPVFSMEGHPDVASGALAAASVNVLQATVRRVALNLAEIVRGISTDELPVFLTVGTRLVVNARTAAAIGYRPGAGVRARAEFLHPEALDTGATPLTFSEALRTAEERNVALSISDAALEISQHEIGRARSPLLPQIGTELSYLNVDPRTLSGIVPDEVSSVGLQIRQMIYDDRSVSDYRASKRDRDGTAQQREAARLDVLASAGSRFLEFVLTRLLYTVQSDNVRLTEDNLELAKRRFEIGYAGRDEVYRWEAQLAVNQSSLLNLTAEVEAARIRLNQAMGVAQDLPWLPEEILVDSNTFPWLGGRIDDVFDDPRAWAKFEEFAVQLALESAPEALALQYSIEAQGIRLGQRTRRWFLPTFDASFNYDYQLRREPAFDDVAKDFHFLEVAAHYPLMEGGFRLYDRRRIQSQMTGLERQQELTRQLVEQSVRTSERRVANSFPVIKLSRTAAEASAKNLDVVQDKYSQGIVDVTNLLDAQNQSLVSNQSAAVSVYQFLLDLVRFQRSISWFEDDKAPEERDALLLRIRETISP